MIKSYLYKPFDNFLGLLQIDQIILLDGELVLLGSILFVITAIICHYRWFILVIALFHGGLFGRLL